MTNKKTGRFLEAIDKAIPESFVTSFSLRDDIVHRQDAWSNGMNQAFKINVKTGKQMEESIDSREFEELRVVDRNPSSLILHQDIRLENVGPKLNSVNLTGYSFDD